MLIIILIVFGLCLGSFVNALVWRVHEQSVPGKKSSKAQAELSILKGRSICPRCKHQLSATDLIPLFSWLTLRGKCRYCKKSIPVQYPLVELATAALFVISYQFWPTSPFTSVAANCLAPCLFHGASLGTDTLFGLWLLLLVGLIALLVYDLRWYLLPNRIMYPLGVLATLMAIISIVSSAKPLQALLSTVGAVAIGGGLFYVLFQVSHGKWIGGGDVKLGWVLGLALGTPGKALLFIFIASVLGCMVSVPLLVTNRLKRSSIIPFGPFLIGGAIFTQLFGTSIIHWYALTLLGA